MEKIKINFTEPVLFSNSFYIIEEDINFAGHMGNERILHWANQIRHSFYRHQGVMEIDPKTMIGTIVANHSIVYKSEGFLNDLIRAEVAVNNITSCSYDLIIRFTKKETGQVLALLRSGTVCFNYQTREIAEIPQELLHAITTPGQP